MKKNKKEKVGECKAAKCGTCNGSGRVPDGEREKVCESCKGWGYVNKKLEGE